MTQTLSTNDSIYPSELQEVDVNLLANQEKAALAAYTDIMSVTPSFDYDLAATGIYERQLFMLRQSRKTSLEAAKRVLSSIMAMPQSELATLLTKSKPLDENRPYRLHPLSYFKSLPKKQWGVEHLIFDRGTSLWAGDGGSGKSVILMNAMLSRAYGKPFIGHDVKQGFIVWVAAESIDEIYSRVTGWMIYNDIPLEDEPPVWFLDERVPFNNMAEVEIFIENMKAQAEAMNVFIDGFVFDTYARCTPGANENDTRDTKLIAEGIARISTAFDTHVAVIHHTSATGRIRGNTALRDDVDTVWVVTKDTDNIITMQCDKMRGFPESKLEPIRLQLHSQMLSETDLEDTAPVVKLLDESEKSQSDLTPKVQRQILGLLEANGTLTYNAWKAQSKATYQIAPTAFYLCVKQMGNDELISKSPTDEERKRGMKVFYSLTERGKASLEEK